VQFRALAVVPQLFATPGVDLLTDNVQIVRHLRYFRAAIFSLLAPGSKKASFLMEFGHCAIIHAYLQIVCLVPDFWQVYLSTPKLN
jgi:hypothetical protein